MDFEIGHFRNFRTLVASYDLPSCITHRPLSRHQTKCRWNRKNILWMDVRTLRPALLGRSIQK